MKDFNFNSIRGRCWAVRWDVTGSNSISISDYAVDIGAGNRDVSAGVGAGNAVAVAAAWGTTATTAIVANGIFGDAGRKSACGFEFFLESH